MSKKIDLSRLPNVPQHLRDLVEGGYGEWSTSDNQEGPFTGLVAVSYDEMEQMGPEQRARLGFESSYILGRLIASAKARQEGGDLPLETAGVTPLMLEQMGPEIRRYYGLEELYQALLAKGAAMPPTPPEMGAGHQ